MLIEDQATANESQTSNFSDSVEVSNDRPKNSLAVNGSEPPASRMQTKEYNTTGGLLHRGTRQQPIVLRMPRTKGRMRERLASPSFASEDYSPVTSRRRPNVSTSSTDYHADAIPLNTAPATSSHEAAMQRVFPALTDLLESDPEKHVLSPKHFETSLNHITLLIRSTVQDFLEAADVNPSRPPQLYEPVQETAFFDLCKRVYGAGTSSELLDKASDLLLQSRLDIKTLLRSLLAAAVTEWALQGGLDALSLNKSEVVESYEKVIQARCEWQHPAHFTTGFSTS